jgi:hypothetical protein
MPPRLAIFPSSRSLSLGLVARSRTPLLGLLATRLRPASARVRPLRPVCDPTRMPQAFDTPRLLDLDACLQSHLPLCTLHSFLNLVSAPCLTPYPSF